MNISTSKIRQLDRENVFAKIDRGKYNLPLSIQSYANYQAEKSKSNDELNKKQEEALWMKVRREKTEVELKMMLWNMHKAKDEESVMDHMLEPSVNNYFHSQKELFRKFLETLKLC